MTADDYADFCSGVRRLTGIDLASYKRAQMERRIRSFAEHQRIASLAAYLELLGRDPDALDRFLDRMTINVSELYRNPEQYDRLRRSVLPELASSRRVRIWSAGSSYGAEAYTLACLALEAMPGVRTEIVGTDIDRRMVLRAQRGLFSQEDARCVPRGTLARWFRVQDGGYQAAEELRGALPLPPGRPAARSLRDGARPRALPQRRHLLHRGEP